jgi:hypothetical protein
MSFNSTVFPGKANLCRRYFGKGCRNLRQGNIAAIHVVRMTGGQKMSIHPVLDWSDVCRDWSFSVGNIALNHFTPRLWWRPWFEHGYSAAARSKPKVQAIIRLWIQAMYDCGIILAETPSLPPPSWTLVTRDLAQAQVLHFLYMSLLHYIKTILLRILGDSQRLKTNTNIAPFLLKVITSITSSFIPRVLILFQKFTTPPRAFCFYRLLPYRYGCCISRLKFLK